MIGLYLCISFGLAWALWLVCWLIGAGLVPLPLTATVILGSFGPFIAAGLCTAWTGGGRAMLRFYGRVLAWRMGWGVLAASLLLMPAIAVLAAAIYAWQHGRSLTFQIGWGDLPLAYLWLLILGGPVAEEFGWSYLSDRLDEKLPVRLATLLLGVIWAFWHLPLFFLVVPGLTQHYMPFGLFLMMSVGARYIFSWAYHRGGRNVLSNLLCHNGLNLGLTIVVIVPPVSGDDHLRLLYLALLSCAAALLLWITLPPGSAGHPHPSR